MASASLPSPSSPQNPHHTLLDKKPPLLPRQSTSDVLSFTHIIANRLGPDQNVWDFFSPPPPPPTPTVAPAAASTAELPPLSPALSSMAAQQKQSTASAVYLSPTSPASPTFCQFQGRRASTGGSGGGAVNGGEMMKNSENVNPKRQSLTLTSRPKFQESTTESTTSPTSNAIAENNTATPKLQKRRSFAQSLKHGMLSLTQLLSPTSSTFHTSSSSTGLSSPTNGPPHYNILVLGSDSAPLASTLYKMSSILPGATKIRHYQEISGFFVAYFRSDGSFSCSPKTKTTTRSVGALGFGTTEGGRQQRDNNNNNNNNGNDDEVKSRAKDVNDHHQLSRKSTSTTNSVAADMEVVIDSDEDCGSGGSLLDDSESDRGTRRGSLAPSLRSCSSGMTSSSSATLTCSTAATTMTTTATKTTPTYLSKEGSESTAITTTEASAFVLGDDGTPSSAEERQNSDVEPQQQQRKQEEDHEPHSVQEQGAEKKEDASSISHDKDNQQQQQHPEVQKEEEEEDEQCEKEQEQRDELEVDDDEEEIIRPSANASLSFHAFSLDTTWPVPRTLAQTFWFPHAHGMIYIVDATRKNDSRGIDHLLNARQFLSSLVQDIHFKRREDMPVVVFANKAGLDPDTCYRVDEIAEILGCEEWDHPVAVVGVGSEGGGGGGKGDGTGTTTTTTRPWCVKSTRADGAGDGLRESVEWLKSRMGEVWQS